MKKFIQTGLIMLILILIASSISAQKKIKEGVVKFEIVSDGDSSPEIAMLGGSTLDLYFTDKFNRMDMSMMGGMMRIQTFAPIDNPENATILMDMMGQKIQITDISEEELKNSNNFMNIDKVKKLTYDTDDKKEIAGYSCYRADMEMDNNQKMSYYITEKIQPPANNLHKSGFELKGYPLEMIIDTGQGFEMVFRAKEVLSSVPKGSFDIPTGYSKKTMEEFQKEMGGMKLGF